MDTAFPGLGTLINIATILVGGTIGMLLGDRLPTRTRDLVTDGLGLVTLLVAATSAAALSSSALTAAVGPGVPVLLVLGAVLIGGIAGSLVGIEARLAGLGGRLQAWVARRSGRPRRPGGPTPADVTALTARQRFIEGWLTTSLLFCVGPLAVLGSLSDGLGTGIDHLVLKSTLDGFAAMAFAASLGVGVLFSAVSVLVIQGGLTLIGFLIGDVASAPYVDSLTAVGGLLLVGVALRLLRIREIPVADLLPALAVVPLLTWLVITLR